MRNGRLLILILILSYGKIKAQQSIFFTQLKETKLIFNPALSSSEDIARLEVINRDQWLNYTESTEAYGAPSSQYVGLLVPMNFAFESVTAISLLRDRLGPLENFNLRLSFSTEKRIGNSHLSLGIQPSFQWLGLLGDGVLNAIDPTDSDLQKLLETDRTNSNSVDFNVGIGLIGRSYTLGLSSTNLSMATNDFTGVSDQLDRVYNLYFDYKFELSYSMELQPYVLLRTSEALTTFDAGAIAYYKSNYGIGLAYRNEESVSLILDFDNIRKSKLSLGFAYDFVISKSQDKRFSTLEMLAKYDLPNINLGKRKIVRTPRFRF